jgi:hypothetical protein
LDYLDKVQTKRQLTAEQKKQERSQKEVIDTTKDSSKTVAHAIAQQGAKSRLASEKLAKSDDVKEVVDTINKLNLTTFLASKDNWASIVDDIISAAEKIQKVSSSIDNEVTKLDSTFTQAVSSLQEAVGRMQTVKVEADKEAVEVLERINSTLNSLEVNPVVNVSAPNVTVSPSKLDLKPLEKALKELKPIEVKAKFSLKCYMAQDLQTDGTFQYVGMVNPEGNWCIIENDMEAEALRFALGDKNYKTAWKNYNNHQFMLFNEAVNAVSA